MFYLPFSVRIVLENMLILLYNVCNNQKNVCKLSTFDKKEYAILSALYKKQSNYSPMLSENQNYEAFSGISATWDFFGIHCHDFFEFYLFHNGMPYFCIDEQVFPLKPYTLVILPPFHLHGLVSNRPTNDYRRSWLYVSPALMRNLGMGIQDFSEFFKECVKNGRAYFYIDAEIALKLNALIESIQQNRDTRTSIERWKNYIYVADFLSIAYDVAKNSNVKCKPIVLNETIQSVLAYINNHFTEPLSLHGLCKQFGLSPSHMSRSFSSYAGTSLYDYILYRRIMLAKEMICADKPFMEVALECGFNDYSCFLRAFTKVTGKTPREYKKYIISRNSGIKE